MTTTTETPPNPWEHSPQDIRLKQYSNISVRNVWKNTETGEVLIQFMTITTVDKNNYVELHDDPQQVESRLAKIKDLISTKDVDTKLTKVAVTGGKHVAKCRTPQQATQEAINYMKK